MVTQWVRDHCDEDRPEDNEAIVIVARSVRGKKPTQVRNVYQLFVDPAGELEHEALVRNKSQILRSVEELLGKTDGATHDRRIQDSR
jgi:hypothetical protein